MPTLPRPKRKEQEGHRRPTSDQKFYGSAIWRKTRQFKLRLTPLCEVHAAKKEYVDCTENNPIDHIVPIMCGGAKIDPNNLMTMCKKCHERKSALELHRGVLVETMRNEFGELIPVQGGRELVIQIILKGEEL